MGTTRAFCARTPGARSRTRRPISRRTSRQGHVCSTSVPDPARSRPSSPTASGRRDRWWASTRHLTSWRWRPTLIDVRTCPSRSATSTPSMRQTTPMTSFMPTRCCCTLPTRRPRCARCDASVGPAASWRHGEADYSASAWYPGSDELDRWLEALADDRARQRRRARRGSPHGVVGTRSRLHRCDPVSKRLVFRDAR